MTVRNIASAKDTPPNRALESLYFLSSLESSKVVGVLLLQLAPLPSCRSGVYCVADSSLV